MDLESHVGHMVQLPPAAPRLNGIVYENKNNNKKKTAKTK